MRDQKRQEPPIAVTIDGSQKNEQLGRRLGFSDGTPSQKKQARLDPKTFGSLKAHEREARAIAARGCGIKLVRAHGQWCGEGKNRSLRAERGPISASYRTPFQKALLVETEQTRYMRALVGGKANLPYGLDIWHERKKVLNIKWSDEGQLEIISFKPGEWEGLLC